MSKTLVKPSREQLTDLYQGEAHRIEAPLERLMMLFGDKYSLMIIDILSQNESLRFVALEAQVTGISPRTLSQRLKHLERYGLLKRIQYPSIPPRVDYELTEKAKALAPVIEDMKSWADIWFPHCPE
jgi:DNA-binding HxlR family transcriptional regulator